MVSRWVLSALLAFVSLLGSGVPAAPTGAQPGGEALTLTAGLGEGVYTWNDFLRGSIRVAQGTTVTWLVGSDEAHTVTFLAGRPRTNVIVPQPESGRPPMMDPDFAFPSFPSGPWDGTTYVNSGELHKETPFSVTFAALGRYDYVCLIHPAMAGSVEVVAPGSEGITTQADVERSVSGDAGRLVTQTRELDRLLDEVVSLPGPNGTTLWFVRAGTDRRLGRLDVMAFLPEDLTIRTGDTVIWHVDHQQIHTVTFPEPGGEEPAFLQLQLADGTLIDAPEAGEPMPPEVMALLATQSSPPRLVLGPGAVPARPRPAHDGRSFFNSGLLGEHLGVTVPLPKAWALTFDAPGEFEYLCLVHDPLGMEGKIVVRAR